MNQFEQYRRKFIGGALATTGAALLPGVMLMEVAHSRAPEEAVSSKHRWGLLIDTTKCGSGCNDCVTACNTEHGLSGKTGPQDSQWIRKVELTNNKTNAVHSLPMMCQHCEHPPCVDVCPDRRIVQACGRHRAGGSPHLHRLPLLHDGVSLQGTLPGA